MNSLEKLLEYCSGYALIRDLPYTKGGLFGVLAHFPSQKSVLRSSLYLYTPHM